MLICKRCGAPLEENYIFCRNCGLPVAEPVYQTPVTVYNPAPIVKKPSAIPYFIWSIILFFCFNIIGTPLAIVAACYASFANAPECENPQKKLKTAKHLCIAATCVDGVTICFFISALIIYITGLIANSNFF